MVATARCGFPEHEFDDAKFNALNAGGSGGQAAGGSAGSTGGSGGDGGASAAGGSAGQAGASGSSGGGQAGSAGQGGAGASGAGGAGGAGEGGAAGVAGASGAGGASGQAGAGGAGGGKPCVDDGATITCGEGECTVEVPKCLNGFLNTCTPGKPQLDLCGNIKDEDCDGTYDNHCKGMCEHDLCTSANALSIDCNPCVGFICNLPKFAQCCTNNWTPDCIAAVQAECGVSSCAGFCSHSPCEVGGGLKAGCDALAPKVTDSCVAKVCQAQPSCCSDTWDASCVKLVNTECGHACTLPQPL